MARGRARRSAKRSGLIKILALALLGYLAYRFLGLPEESGAPPLVGSGGDNTRSAVSYALRAEDSWPPLQETEERIGQGVASAADLLAANYYVLLDGSGSMNDVACSAGKTKIEAARVALDSFSASVPAGANLGLTVFEQRGIGELLPLGVGNRQTFHTAVSQVRAGGGTPLRTAISLAYEKLFEQGRRQLGYGEYNLVVVTDGIASRGEDPTDMVNRMLAESPVLLSTIGFCVGDEHSLNQPGRTYYRAADNPAALRKGLEAVLAEAPAFDLSDFEN
jgi:Ca-activated chloride channel family protein